MAARRLGVADRMIERRVENGGDGVVRVQGSGSARYRFGVGDEREEVAHTVALASLAVPRQSGRREPDGLLFDLPEMLAIARRFVPRRR